MIWIESISRGRDRICTELGDKGRTNMQLPRGFGPDEVKSHLDVDQVLLNIHIWVLIFCLVA